MITTINEFKKFLNENNSNDEARNIFMGVLSESLIQQIESTFKVSYGIVEDNYYIQLSTKQGYDIDRITYHPTGEIQSNVNEWWTAKSSLLNPALSFETYNKLAEWFNKRTVNYGTHNIDVTLSLPLINDTRSVDQGTSEPIN